MRQIYCEECGTFKALRETGPINVPGGGIEYYELHCGACSRLIGIVRVSATKPEAEPR
jgi:hypothetical protein